MKSSGLKALKKDMKERHKYREKAWKLTFTALLAVSLLGVATFPEPEAMTLPFGVIFFHYPPTEEAITHELCHWERMQEIGWPKFYWDYLTGGGPAEEARCGDPNHPVAKYPWMRKP